MQGSDGESRFIQKPPFTVSFFEVQIACNGALLSAFGFIARNAPRHPGRGQGYRFSTLQAAAQP
jgi:hypothetical protein